MDLLRHENTEMIGSELDPIEDLLTLFTSLTSTGFCAEILSKKHNFVNKKEINTTSQLISLHVENAIGLATQAFEGPPQNSFLPLYYSTLNFIKIIPLIKGLRIRLSKNRWHGAKYHESQMNRNFLNEEISISSKGTIPLLYYCYSGLGIPKRGIKISMDEIYSSISSVGAEYKLLTGNFSRLLFLSSSFIEDFNNGHYLKIEIIDDPNQKKPSPVRKIKAFPQIQLIENNDQIPFYKSVSQKGDFNTFKKNYKNSSRRDLLSDIYFQNKWFSYTQISSRHHVFCEEMYIMLAYFHLSNVVRYNPEHLYKLMDSKYWALMLALRKHGYLKFLKLVWGEINKMSFDID